MTDSCYVIAIKRTSSAFSGKKTAAIIIYRHGGVLSRKQRKAEITVSCIVFSICLYYNEDTGKNSFWKKNRTGLDYESI